MSLSTLSPAAHNIIRCGKEISSRPFLDEILYNDHLNTHLINEFPIPSNCTDYIDQVIDSVKSKISSILN